MPSYVWLNIEQSIPFYWDVLCLKADSVRVLEVWVQQSNASILKVHSNLVVRHRRMFLLGAHPVTAAHKNNKSQSMHRDERCSRHIK